MMVWLILVIFGTAKGKNLAEFDIPETSIFSASISCSPSYKSTRNIICNFHLKNNGHRDYSVLKWGTPLDGLTSDSLDVTHDGKKLSYDGIFAKRSMPGPEEFLLVAGGQNVSSAFDVSVAYDMSKNGNYSVALDTNIEYAVGSVKGMNLPGKPAIHTKIAHLSSPTVSFIVSGGRMLKRTLGQRARSFEGENKRTLSLTKNGNGPLEPVVEGNSGLVEETKRVHRLAFDYTVSAISDLKNMQKSHRFKTWFGNSDAKHFAYILETYEIMEAVLKSQRVKYVYGDYRCRSNWYAFTYHGGRTIYLCGIYENIEIVIGMDTKMGTLVHELSHALAWIKDVVYGEYSCKHLAKSNPYEAAENADSYQYFVSSTTV